MARQRPVAERLQALGHVVEQVEGRVPDEAVRHADELVRRAGSRLAIAGDHTVVALAGATGSGKSSLFNALSGTQLAEPGVRRPTTAKAMSVSWGDVPPAELLDWLDVPRRHQVELSRVPRPGSQAPGLEGLVLLDLPDHDSIEAAHRAEVDRLVDLVDLLVWVVDPQKYADAALHERYLKPLAGHAEVMLVVLNQVDLLTPGQLVQCERDLRRLLDNEGLGKARIAAVSATTGQGVDALRRQVVDLVARKRVVAERLGADLTREAARLAPELGLDDSGSAGDPAIGSGTVRQLNRALAEAAGADVVTEAVLASVRRRGELVTGWPVLSWIASLRPDPLRRLHLDRLPIGRTKKSLEPVRVPRTGLDSGQGASKARVTSAVRALSDEAAADLPRSWQDAVRRASLANQGVLADELDRAVATTDLAMDRGFGHWRVIQVVQWILVAVVAAGLLWLAADLVLAYFHFPPLPTRSWHRLPVQTWLVVGGVAAGLLLALISRVFVEVSARAKARRAHAVLTRQVAAVAERQVVAPVTAELVRLRTAREALGRVRG
ncbi:GTPase [Aestuariimicrobium kwangyangense]|uniref:GTPase n=1 Tax=Aestuariimicrobium kwangyangense TaxID=396389 RepID=UPI0003B5BCA3|nr:GTPase [Aestuariimicrobium kwangyangense]